MDEFLSKKEKGELFTQKEKKEITMDLEELDTLSKDVQFDQFASYSEAPRILEESKKHRGRPTGFETLDFLIGGVSSGELIVVTATAGTGKTCLLQSITWKLAKQGIPSLWYSLENTTENFIVPFVKNDPEAKWDDAGKLLKVSNMPVYWPKNVENLDFNQLKKAIRYAHLTFGTQHVFVDHLHYLISGKDMMAAKSTSLFIGDRLRQLRAIAIETEVSIFLVAHMAKVMDGVKPTMNDLRDSSFLQQEADSVILLYRERLKNPIIRQIDGFQTEMTHSSIVTGTVEKSRRTGQKGLFYLQWFKGLYDEIPRNQAQMLMEDERQQSKEPKN